MIIVAVDIGTTKICVLIAHHVQGGTFDIIGIGKAPSKGLARGVVVDILSAAHSIKTALKEAELMAGCSVESAVIGISGSHINAFNSTGMISIKHGEIRQHDIDQVLAVAQSVPLAEGQQILHVLPQWFTIDNDQRVQDPLGMFGIRLEAQVHIITGAVASVQNLIRCCELAGIKVQDIILEPLASADAVLSSDEREMGVALLDIGGGTSDFAIYQHSAIRHTKVYPIAGTLFTHDIAVVLRTTLTDAERIKKEHGAVHASYLVNDHEIMVECAQGGQTKSIYEQEIYEILECRIHELFLFMGEEIKKNHLEFMVPSGLVITGGGSLIQGMQECAQEILGLPTRIGRPRGMTSFKELLDNPMYATGYGLLLQGIKKQQVREAERFSGVPDLLKNKILGRMKSWIFDFF